MEERLAELERRLIEANRQRDEFLQEAARALEEAESAREEAERKFDNAKAQIQPTTWFEFLKLCHNLIYMKMQVQSNPLLASTGAVANVTGKRYPRYLRPWKEFDQLHEDIFAKHERMLGQQRLLPPFMDLEMQGRRVRRGRKLAGEKDLKRFSSLALEGCVDDVVDRLLEPGEAGDDGAPPPIYCQILPAVRDISFLSKPYGVVFTDSDEEEQELALRIQSFTAGREAALGAERGPEKQVSPELTKPHPGFWCFRHNDDDSMVPLFFIEYKAPHKVDNDALRNVLRSPRRAETLMEDSIRSVNGKHVSKELPPNEIDIAKILTQAFDHMVDYGLQYSYVSTGLALIFLYLEPGQPTTVYYHLEQPKTDVTSTDRAGLKHTAVALILTAVHLSLGGKYMKQSWKKQAKDVLCRWPHPYDDMAACDASPPTSETQPAPSWTFPVDTVLTPTLPYCSQACLLGLKRGGALDPRCPNHSLHRQMNQDEYANQTTNKHPISAAEFCSKLVEQLAQTMDEDCHSLERYGMFGATGAMFKVALRAYGYCLVAKGVQRQHRPRLDLESLSYECLEPCQGALVPIYLGIIDLQDEYRNMFGAHFAHMMLLSYCGSSLWHVNRDIQQQAAARKRKGDESADIEVEARTKILLEEQERTLTEIAPYGIDHGDIRPENMVWNEESGRVMVIDFDRAVLREAVEAEKKRERQREKERVRKKRLAADNSDVPATRRRTEAGPEVGLE